MNVTALSRRTGLALTIAGILTACSAARPDGPGAPGLPANVTPDATPGWRAVASDHDRERVRGWWDTWGRALTDVRAGGQGGELARDPALFEPRTLLTDPVPPPGDYACRTIKLGSILPGGGLHYIAYPAFKCRIEGDGAPWAFTKLTGSQRPVGRIWPDTPQRGIFLGTLALGDERAALTYGADRERDMVALVERIGPRRWRMVFPRPAFESQLDLIELIPAQEP